MNKKKIFTIIGSLIFLMGIVVAVILFKNANNSKEMDSYDKYINAAINTHPVEIFVFGKDCSFRDTVEYKTIIDFDSDNLYSDKEYKLIIVNDIDGNISLSDEEYSTIHDYIFDKHYAFLYIGTNLLQEFVKHDFIMDNFEKGDCSFGIRPIDEGMVAEIGTWDMEAQGYYDNGNKELLGECIFVSFIAHLIKRI